MKMDAIQYNFSKTMQLCCHELFTKTPVNFFSYSRFYKEGMISLTTHEQWHEYCQKETKFLMSKKHLSSGVHSWRSKKKFPSPFRDTTSLRYT